MVSSALESSAIKTGAGWQWQIWENKPYLTCTLLQDFAHGFFSRSFSPLEPVDMTPVLDPDATAFRLKQVHGDRNLTPTEIQHHPTTEYDFPPADGLVSDAPGQALWVASADCTPVLIADARSRNVAAIHAGWRGTAKRIVPKVVERLLAQGSQPGDLRVALGPSIAGDIYQVCEEVAAEVGRSLPIAAALGQDQDVIAFLQTLPDCPVFDDPQPGRIRLDVRKMSALQLQLQGLAPEQLAIAPHCTFGEPELFFSYRREKLKKVQWSGIVSR
ncbi:MAG: peptidoglycan editing factor PgeF [Cyanobacteria bacterium P01_H01_bin.15]